ncbi:MAG: THUMP domain-containing protein [Candidatus Woesearchaeota archaeon]|jgi:thiamine biosynthesis protein ThiI|nr:THUMP domain-containing protein [Candidatus Woesearchaeota archaeon]
MHNTIIVRYGEIALKGKNRKFFEEKLIYNIKSFLKLNKTDYSSVSRPRGRILIETNDKCGFLKEVFGITSFSYATGVESNIKGITEKCIEFAKTKLNDKKTFKIDTNRQDKRFNLTSMQVNVQIGSIIAEKTKAKVKLKDPDLTLYVEIADDTYIFTEIIPANGGLPVGIEGSVYALIEDRSSLLAAILAMKRGCAIYPVAYKEIDITLLNKFDSKVKLKIIGDLTELNCDKAIVVNQTLENLKNIDSHLVLRPLIGYSEKEIKEKLKEFQ